MFHQDHLKGQLYENLTASRHLFQCQDCGKQYNTQLGYRRHLVASHSTAEAHHCMKESPAMLENLAEHGKSLLSTEGSPNVPVRERKYSCERCDRRFYTRKDVRRHAVVHTGRRDFLCPCCAQRFGRRDHLTRHLKKSHAQESGFIPPSTPGSYAAAQASTNSCPLKEELSLEPCASKNPSETFARELSTSYTLPNLIPAMGHSHGVVQGSLSSSMGVAHHLNTHSSQSHRHGHQPTAPSPQQPYGNLTQYQYGSTSYHRSDMESFLLDLQSIPSTQLSTMNASVSASPQKEILGDGLDVSGDTHPLPRGPAVSTNDLPCNSNVDLGSLFSFLPFSLPPYNPHMGLVMGCPPAPSPTSSQSSSSGFSAQAPGPFTFLQPPQAHATQGSRVFNHNQLPQSYSPAVSSSTSLPHYYHAFQQ